MKKIVLYAVLVILLAACGHPSSPPKQFNTDTWEGWLDSVSHTTQELSFMGVALGTPQDSLNAPHLVKTLADGNIPIHTVGIIPFGAHAKVWEIEDVLSANYAYFGDTKTEENIHRTSFTFEGKVFQIIVETSNDSIYQMILDSYKSKLHCEYRLPEKATIKFKNAQMEFDEKENLKNNYHDFRDIGLGQMVLANPNYDSRFESGNLYTLIFTDTRVTKRLKELKQHTLRLQQKQRDLQEKEIQRKTDSIKSSLKKQF